MSRSAMSASPAAASNVTNQSLWLTMPLRTVPGSIFPGHRTSAGTRYAPSQLEFFSFRNGVMPTVHVRAVVRRIHHDGVVCQAEAVEFIKEGTDEFVVVEHGVVVLRLPAPGTADALRFRMGPEVHVGGVEPQEEWLVPLLRAPQ